jgi:hypothetical protein
MFVAEYARAQDKGLEDLPEIEGDFAREKTEKWDEG